MMCEKFSTLLNFNYKRINLKKFDNNEFGDMYVQREELDKFLI